MSEAADAVCCDRFAQAIRDNSVSWAVDSYGVDDGGSYIISGMVFCPWCGAKLPRDEDAEREWRKWIIRNVKPSDYP